ncbi:MAG: hypothetical protein OXB84_04005, partial [Halobacteriovoraceae bacterium]|nr:hypothetical protein [Halobacteriovoraceae bacterium]
MNTLLEELKNKTIDIKTQEVWESYNKARIHRMTLDQYLGNFRPATIFKLIQGFNNREQKGRIHNSIWILYRKDFHLQPHHHIEGQLNTLFIPEEVIKPFMALWTDLTVQEKKSLLEDLRNYVAYNLLVRNISINQDITTLRMLIANMFRHCAKTNYGLLYNRPSLTIYITLDEIKRMRELDYKMHQLHEDLYDNQFLMQNLIGEMENPKDIRYALKIIREGMRFTDVDSIQ